MVRTAGRRRLSSWSALGALALGAVVVQPYGCAQDDEKISGYSPEVQDTLSQLLLDTWPEVVEPALADAKAATEQMVAATQTWEAAISAGSGAKNARTEAQVAWRAAMAAWERAELMQLGPAGASLTTVGGLDLRDEIYSWPTTNACRVDQETAEAAWDDGDFFDANLVNVYGFDAVEVLLFGPADDNACPPQVPPNSDGAFEALGEDGVSLNRARYATALGQQIIANIDAIHDGWDAEGGDFAGTLATAGESGSAFSSQESGLNSIFDALFYLELRTKDRKLAWPLGLNDCGLDDCTGMVEAPIADSSHTWVVENLTGFESLYTGNDGVGMGELMIAVGQTDIHLDVLDSLDKAKATAQALQMPLNQALVDDPEGLQALHDDVKAVTDVLKGDLATLLMLQVPTEAAGDND